MSEEGTRGAARLSRGPRLAASKLARAVRVLLAWRWTALLAKLTLGALGLLLLAAVGRSALAGARAEGTGAPAAYGPPGGAALPGAPSPSPAPLPPTGVAPTVAIPVGSPAPAAATPAPVEDAGAPAPAPSRRATPDDPVFLNLATFDDLRRLPGVGPKRAQAILALRQRLGRFRQVEDLLKVKGVGRASLRKLRPLVRVDSPGGPRSS
jgi:competence protein ComEA